MTARVSINDEADGISAPGPWLTRLFHQSMAANWSSIDRIDVRATGRIKPVAGEAEPHHTFPTEGPLRGKSQIKYSTLVNSIGRDYHMQRIIGLFAAVCFSVVFLANGANAASKPSSGAQGMAGALGTFTFKPSDHKAGTDTWWRDTDGVAPGAAGCHIGTNKNGAPNGRMFAEACLATGELVESNPGADVVHKHTNDEGHPDKFDCNAYCIGMGSTSGACVASPAPPCGQSAICACK